MQSKLSFLIVDDDPDMVAVIAALLGAAGHDTHAETDPNNAIPTIRRQRPDCVLIDIMMPGIDGLELVTAIRADPDLSKTHLIVVSAKPYEFDRKRAYKLGADGFISKPIDVSNFVATVQTFIDDKIAMTFWGVRGTLPVSGPEIDRYGGNTNCVTLEFTRGRLFIFDAGTGIKTLGDHLMRQGRKRMEAKIFVSHPHWDHINALPFFVPLYVAGNEFEILGAKHGDLTMREIIGAQMDDVYFPITMKEFAARVYFRDLREETFDVDGIKVSTMLLSHPGYCLGYRIEYKGRSVCYITDNELFLETDERYDARYVKRLTQFIAGADALITDCTYTDAEYKTKVGWGHSALGPVVALADAAAAKTLYLYHHDPDQNDAAIDAKFAAAKAMLAERGSKTRCLAPKERETFIL